MAARARLLLLLLVAGLCGAQQERSISSGPRRRNRLPAGKSEVLDFSCPEDFGYYQHPTDCTQYYVCVFGGALQESCSGGLVYSHDLQTCDWPRNVACNVDLSAPVSTVRVTDPRTAAPPPAPRPNLTPSVSSNGFAETLKSPSGRKEQLSGPSSSAVNRQGRIIGGGSDRSQQDIRGRFQLQESTNRAFSVSPTTTSRTFSFPDRQRRQKRATPDQSDHVTDSRIQPRQGRYDENDSVRYPRIMRREYESASKNLAEDGKNFMNFKRPEMRTSDFKFLPFGDGRQNSPKKTHDFFSLDSIEEDLDRGQSLLADLKLQQRSDVLYRRPIPGGQNKWPPANKNMKRAVGPSAFSYNAVKTPPHPDTQRHSFRSQPFDHLSLSHSSKIESKFGNNQPSTNKFYSGVEQAFEVRPASGFSSSSSANPFSKFVATHDQKHTLGRPPVRERPKPRPQEIKPFHDQRPDHEYTIGPPSRQEAFEHYDNKFYPKLNHRGINDRPRHHDQFPSSEGHHNGKNGEPQYGTSHASTPLTKLSHLQPTIKQSDNLRYFENAPNFKFPKASLTPASRPSSTRPTQASQEFHRPFPAVSGQKLKNPPAYENDYTLHRNPPEKQLFKEGSDDFLHPTPGTRYHEELDYPLILENYEYDDYYYGELQFPPFQNYELPSTERPREKYPPLPSWHREPGSLNPNPEEKEEEITPRPHSYFPATKDRKPTTSTKVIGTNSQNRPRPPALQPPREPYTSNPKASEDPSRQPSSTPTVTTKRPSRPTRPKIHIPVHRHRKTTTTTTVTPPVSVTTTSKPFTFPPYEKSSSSKGNRRGSAAGKQPIHIPGTARHPELSRLPDSAPTEQQTTDGRHSQKRQNSRPALPGSAPASPFKNQFESRPQSSSSFRNSEQQQSPAVTPAPSALDDNFYIDLLNLTDAEYFSLYEDLLLEDYFDGTAGSTTPKPTTRAPVRQSSQRQSQSSAPAKVDSSRPSRLTLQPVSEIVKNNNHQVTNIWKYPPRRPAPLYPQPPYNTLATKCDRKACRLPDCSCGGKEVPGGIAPQDVPQMVLLTFDDSVNDLNKELYQELFERGRTNPNGCPLAATFYISHEWTDYSQVQNLYADGHEIASHSITHSFGEQFSKLKWAKEIAGQREIMAAYGGVRMEDVRGMRAPFLAVGGNKMFEMLYEQNFTYDSSMPVYENRPPSYPYTLDYKLFHDCMIPPCPTNSFPGLWEVPMVMWQDLNGGRCSMGDACTTPPDAEGVYKMLIKNFERHYTTNRAPMGLFYHAAWFTTPHHKEGFIAFLDTISGMPDVWLVTNWQALQWMRDPVPISQANSFKPFQCNYPERPPRCKTHRVCNVWHKGGVRYMRTCQKCPDAYPWVGRTGVPSPLNDA